MSNSAQTLSGKRIESLLDDNSFVEVGSYVTARNTDFNMTAQETAAGCNYRIRYHRRQSCVCVQPGCVCYGRIDRRNAR